MALCKKGYTLETKVCGKTCKDCEHYDTKNRKERLKDLQEKAKRQIEYDIINYAPKDCGECKYLDSGTSGFNDFCLAMNISFPKPNWTSCNNIEKICPLKSRGEK